MADLDTVAKRVSGINIGCPWRAALPIPDGTIDQGDMQTLALSYSGVLADVLSATLGGVVTQMRRRSR